FARAVCPKQTDDPTRAQPQVNVADDWGTLVPDREIRSRYNWHNHPSRKAGLKAKAGCLAQTRALQCRRHFTLQRPQTQHHVRQSHDGCSMLPRFAETIHRPKE
ncbi:hypothetical protein, partial [Bifidobacterium longum]|uniref:hypothetical protein n=1 Tax=Bifidobacterium longum TaxID=216816 RepID=UPI001F3D88D8